MKWLTILGIVLALGLVGLMRNSRQYIKKRDWQGIVVHHSGSQYDNFASIDKYHRSKGWDMCGYHYVIEKDGIVFEGRPLSKDGAHAKTCGPNRNQSHVGICLTGNAKFTPAQEVALKRLCRKLIKQYSIRSIERHHEDCPSDSLDVEGLAKELLSFNE